MARPLTPLPPVTDEHRRAAHQAMAWTGWTYERAMADPIRSRLVECRAHQLRLQQWQQHHRAERFQLATWQHQQPATQQRTDCKRAAAGDRDD